MNRKKIPELALKAFKEAIRQVVEEHRRDGRKLAVWRNGKVMHVSANKGSGKER